MTAEVLQGCVLSPLIFFPHTLTLTTLYDTIFIGYVEDISLASLRVFFQTSPCKWSFSIWTCELVWPWMAGGGVTNSLHEKHVVVAVSGWRGWVYGSNCSLSVLTLFLIGNRSQGGEASKHLYQFRVLTHTNMSVDDLLSLDDQTGYCPRGNEAAISQLKALHVCHTYKTEKIYFYSYLTYL